MPFNQWFASWCLLISSQEFRQSLTDWFLWFIFYSPARQSKRTGPSDGHQHHHAEYELRERQDEDLRLRDPRWRVSGARRSQEGSGRYVPLSAVCIGENKVPGNIWSQFGGGGGGGVVCSVQSHLCLNPCFCDNDRQKQLTWHETMANQIASNYDIKVRQSVAQPSIWIFLGVWLNHKRRHVKTSYLEARGKTPDNYFGGTPARWGRTWNLILMLAQVRVGFEPWSTKVH